MRTLIVVAVRATGPLMRGALTAAGSVGVGGWVVVVGGWVVVVGGWVVVVGGWVVVVGGWVVVVGGWVVVVGGWVVVVGGSVVVVVVSLPADATAAKLGKPSAIVTAMAVHPSREWWRVIELSSSFGWGWGCVGGDWSRVSTR
jgi:hypothetical protein